MTRRVSSCSRDKSRIQPDSTNTHPANYWQRQCWHKAWSGKNAVVKRIMSGDRPYLIPFGVFDPHKHQSGLLVAEYVQQNAAAWAGTRVLELGTGCGVIAGALYDAGADVVATDVSRFAVETAVGNLVGTTVDVRRGDLFDPVRSDRFDTIVMNPPYEIGWSLRPRYRSPDLLERIAAEWRRFADRLVLAFPTDSAEILDEVGLDLHLVDCLESGGRELGIFSHPAP